VVEYEEICKPHRCTQVVEYMPNPKAKPVTHTSITVNMLYITQIQKLNLNNFNLK